MAIYSKSRLPFLLFPNPPLSTLLPKLILLNVPTISGCNMKMALTHDFCKQTCRVAHIPSFRILEKLFKSKKINSNTY